MTVTRARSSLPKSWRGYSTRWLDVVSAICAATALVLLVLPWAVPTTMRAPEGSGTSSPGVRTTALAHSLTTVTAGPGENAAIEVVVNGNVFSATRHAPLTEFVVPGQSGLEVVPMMTAMPVTGAMPSEGDVLPRLSAIVAMNGERLALLQFVASDGAPRLYRINDVHAGYRVVRIDSTRVVLAGRAGTRVLRLSPRPAPDSLKKLP